MNLAPCHRPYREGRFGLREFFDISLLIRLQAGVQSRGLPSGRIVASYATGKHGVPGGAGWLRARAVMPGHSIAAAAAICGAPDSN